MFQEGHSTSTPRCSLVVGEILLGDEQAGAPPEVFLHQVDLWHTVGEVVDRVWRFFHMKVTGVFEMKLPQEALKLVARC